MSRFVLGSSQRIQTVLDSETNLTQARSLITESFEDITTQTITMISINLDHSNDISVQIKYNNSSAYYVIPPWSTIVLVWKYA